MANLTSKSLEQHRTLRIHLVGAVEHERAKLRAVLTEIPDAALEISEAGLNASAESTAEGDLLMVVFNSEEAAPLGYLQANAGATPVP